MSDREIRAIRGLKSELKGMRHRVRELQGQNDRWRSVARTLRQIAGMDDIQFQNLLRGESLLPE